MIYAIHKRTKEHVITRRGESWPSKEWDLVQDIGDGWIAWRGESRESPLPDVHNFDYMVRSGEVVEGKWASYWAHTGTASDIIGYRPILDESSEPEAAEWSGEGLPPVGCECEYQNNRCCPWQKMEVTAIGRERILLWDFSQGCEVSRLIKSAGNFRPIRSEEDRLTDEALDEIEADGDDKRTIRSTVARMIHAGYRKG